MANIKVTSRIRFFKENPRLSLDLNDAREDLQDILEEYEAETVADVAQLMQNISEVGELFAIVARLGFINRLEQAGMQLNDYYLNRR